MSTIAFITIIGGAMLVFGIAGAILAGVKNRDVSFWTAWAFLFPPSIVVLLFLAKIKGQRPRRTSLDEEDTMLDQV